MAAVIDRDRSLVLGRHEGDSVATTNDHHLALAIGVGELLLLRLLMLAVTAAALHTTRRYIQLQLLNH